MKAIIQQFAYRKFFGGIFAFIGAWFTANQIADYLWTDQFLIDYRISIAVICLILWLAWTFCRCLPNLLISRRIRNSDTTIRIKVGDIFSSKNTIVVAAPTTFDIEVSEKLISKKSVQGQYQSRYFADSVALQNQVNEALDGEGIDCLLTPDEKPYGNKSKFHLGKCIYIKNSKRNAIYVSFATFNKNLRAQLTNEEFTRALPQMWSEIVQKGDNGPIDIGLIGAGFSRLNAKKKDILAEIVGSFVASSREQRITEQLTIFLQPSLIQDNSNSLEEARLILDSRCGNVPVGVDNTIIESSPVER